MPTTSVVWKSPRSQVAIQWLYTNEDGRCLTTTAYRVESLHRLSRKTIDKLRETGLIGYGQEWCIKNQCDGFELPIGKDSVKAVEISNFTGDVVNYDPIHSYTGTKFQAKEIPYYEYLILDTCDSSD